MEDLQSPIDSSVAHVQEGSYTERCCATERVHLSQVYYRTKICICCFHTCVQTFKSCQLQASRNLSSGLCFYLSRNVHMAADEQKLVPINGLLMYFMALDE